ncbi:MAG: glycerophosphodiester phosphodiesterase family protein [Candidatus Hydrogenedentota bacterium]
MLLFARTLAGYYVALALIIPGVTMADSKTNEVTVIAHRGASKYAPENTLAAFELAYTMKADYFELDCTLSKDGEVIVIHDDTLDRTTNIRGRVMNTASDVIGKADAGTWFDEKFAGEPVPTLGESLDMAKGKIGVYIEIKDSDRHDKELLDLLFVLGNKEGSLLPEAQDKVLRIIEEADTPNLELTRKVIQQVRDRGMENEIIIQSFSPIVCAIACIEAPEMRTELLASSINDNPDQWPDYQTWAKLLKPKGFNCHKNLVTQELVDEFHELGMTLAVWTVDGKREMQNLAAMGVDALITNRPDVCLEVLGR